MGAWSTESFGNDDAGDWACDFVEESEDLSMVKETLASVFKEEYLEAPVAAMAIAACEVLARLRGNHGLQDSHSERIDQWVAANPQQVDGELIAAANRAIDRIMAADSEMDQLWEESDSYDEWKGKITDLRDRLGN